MKAKFVDCEEVALVLGGKATKEAIRAYLKFINKLRVLEKVNQGEAKIY